MHLNKSQIIPPDTERLSFRYLTKEDVEPWKKFVLSRKASQYFPFPNEESQSEIWIERQLKRYQDGKGGMLGVIEKESGILIGQCGLLIHIDNVKSKGVAEKNGLQVWKVTTWKEMLVEVWRTIV